MDSLDFKGMNKLPKNDSASIITYSIDDYLTLSKFKLTVV